METTITIGSTLKVNNFLTTDPAHKQGETGEVIDIQDDDIFTLLFPDGVIAKYSGEECFTEI